MKRPIHAKSLLVGQALILIGLALIISIASAHSFFLIWPFASNHNPHNMAMAESASALSWTYFSSRNGDLPSPAASLEQTASLVLDVDKDGVNDFVIGTRKSPGPSVVWFRREASGWTRYVIDNTVLRVEAGGAFYDIDDDGDLDIVFGRDISGKEIWWWENPYPNYSPNTSWTRRLIKTTGCHQHHDMMFGDFDQNNKPELVFWNQSNPSQDGCSSQNAGTLFMTEIPADVKTRTTEWPRQVLFKTGSRQTEGLAAADIDLDGQSDIVGGGYWFKLDGSSSFTANLVEQTAYVRVAAGDVIAGGRPEIIQMPGDAAGMGRLYEWNGSTWVGRDLLQVIHAHSLDIVDIDEDGKLDIFLAEMRKVGATEVNPNARTLVLLGDGQGNFETLTVATGIGQHESRAADLDGDGDIDILGKPYIWDTPRVDVWLNNLRQPDIVCNSLDRWQTRIIDPTRPWRAVFIDSADIDGDGLEDIVTGAWWYRNPGTSGETWSRQPIDARIPANATAPVADTFNQMAVLADFDGDNDIDILGTKYPGGTAAAQNGNAFVWARNDGSGAFEMFETGVAPASGTFLQGARTVSFSPGNLEVVLSWHNESLARLDSLIVPASPATQSWSLRTLSTVSQSEDLSINDIDRDGDPDILLGTKWLQNQGNGQSWSDHTLFNTTELPDRNRLADLNDDGRLDAVIGYETANAPGKVAWYAAPDTPTGSWNEQILDTIIAPMSLDVGDADGDGDFDVVAGEHNLNNPASGRVFVYENNDGAFERHLVATGHEHHDGTQFGDFNNDGALEFISIGWSHGNVLLYRQVPCSSGTIPTATPETPTSTPEPTATVDTPTPTPEPSVIPETPTSTPEPSATAATPTSTPESSATPETSAPAYSFVVAAGAGNYQRLDKPAEITVNFTQNLIAQGETGAFDPNSIRVVEIDSNDAVIDADVAFQFDPASDYEPNQNASGTLVFLMKGTTPANATRRYHVYFDVTGKGFSAPSFTSLVTTTDNINWNGYQSIRLVTQNGTYYYHKPGGGFASLFDAGNNDWISWNSSTTPSGAAGDFRGIPNMVFPSDGGYFHPGRSTAATTLVSQGPLKATFRSTSDNNEWTTVWEVFPTYARMTVTKAPATNYWFLYEGTPGGLLETGTDTLTRSDGSTIPASGTWTTDIPDEEWLYVSDPNVGRSLFLAHLQEDSLVDAYYPMDGLMTVFGFGRNGTQRFLNGTGRQLTIGLVNSTNFQDVKQLVRNAYAPLSIEIENGGAPTSTPTPTETTTPIPPASPTAIGSATNTATPGTSQTATPTACAIDPATLIRNPGFESGATNWTFYSDKTGNSFSTSNQTGYGCGNFGKVTINTTGNNIQLYQSGFEIQNGARYRLRFDARANGNRNIGLFIQLHNSPNTNLGLSINSLGLSSNWQNYEYSFTATSTTTNARLRLWLANIAAGTEIAVDNFSLVPDQPASTATSTLAPTTTSTPVQSPTTQPTSTSTPVATGTSTGTPTPSSTGPSSPTAAPTGTLSPTATPPPTNTPGACFIDPATLIRNPGFQSGATNWTFYSNASGNTFAAATETGYDCGNVGKVTINTTGNNIQLYQSGFAIQNGTRYRLRFDARANAGRSMALYIQLQNSPYTNLGLSVNPVSLTTNWQTYEYTFTATGTTSNARLRLWLANIASGTQLSFDNFSLVPEVGAEAPGSTLTPTVTITPVVGTPTATTSPSSSATPTITQASSTATPSPTASAATNTPTPTAISTATATPGSAQCPPPVSGNPISNPGFESGTSNWTFYSNAQASFATTTTNPQECLRSAQISIQTEGTNVQLYQAGIALQPNTAYRLRLAARSTSGRDADIFLAKHTSPFTSYGLNTRLDLTAGWQTFEITFTTQGFSSPVSDGRLRIWLAGTDAPGEIFYFDNFVLLPDAGINPTATPTPVSTLPANACTSAGAIGQWRWQRREIDSARPGMATFLFPMEVNNDGDIDFITGKFWYENPGTAGGAWTRRQLPAPLEDVVAVYDFDNDGDLDLFASAGTTEPSGQRYWWPFVWARNNGDATFTVFQNIDNSSVTMPENDPVQGVAIARYTASGPLEIAITWDDTEVPTSNPYGVMMFTVPAQPETQQWARRQISTVSSGEQLSAADLDDDNDLDIFMGDKWLRNNHPTSTWTPITILYTPNPTQQTSRHFLYDMDGDTDLDAIIGYSHNQSDSDRQVVLYKHPQNSESNWPNSLIGMINRGHAESLDAADIDGDGDLDVVVGEYVPNGSWSGELAGSLWIYENLGQGASWTRHLVYDGDSHYQSNVAVDVDGDGDLDILSKGFHHRRVHLYENLSGCAGFEP